MRQAECILLFGLTLAISGCCGGYAVVRTTVHDRAEVRPSGELVPGGGTVLHYSRIGEPPNACGSGAKYAEDLWIQVPSVDPGAAFTIGAGDVIAVYVRDQDGNPVRATLVAGKLRIKERAGDSVDALLQVTIHLPSGEVVKLDDDYAFHARAAPQ
jgi:hypothetical protein